MWLTFVGEDDEPNGKVLKLTQNNFLSFNYFILKS